MNDYPFDLALHTALEEVGYNVSYGNGILFYAEILKGS